MYNKRTVKHTIKNPYNKKQYHLQFTVIDSEDNENSHPLLGRITRYSILEVKEDHKEPLGSLYHFQNRGM